MAHACILFFILYARAIKYMLNQEAIEDNGFSSTK